MFKSSRKLIQSTGRNDTYYFDRTDAVKKRKVRIVSILMYLVTVHQTFVQSPPFLIFLVFLTELEIAQ